MATSFSAAALGAEGLAADVTMLVGNGYVPGHAAFALEPHPDDSIGTATVRTAGDVMTGKLNLDPALVAGPASWPAGAAADHRPGRTHTTVSVERAVLRLAAWTARTPAGCRG